MDFDQIRDTLFQAMEDQRQTDIANNEIAQRLGQQKIMYGNEARGTLYSGIPTWQRAQLAAEGTANLADINNKYLSKKMSIWENITSTLDKINSYNKAAAAMNKAAENSSATQSFLNIYNSLLGGE